MRGREALVAIGLEPVRYSANTFSSCSVTAALRFFASAGSRPQREANGFAADLYGDDRFLATGPLGWKGKANLPPSSDHQKVGGDALAILLKGRARTLRRAGHREHHAYHPCVAAGRLNIQRCSIVTTSQWVREGLVPQKGFEPLTPSLRMTCSTD